MNKIHPFFLHIRAQHPNPDNFAEFLAACERPLRKSIRVNTLKISVADFKKLAIKRAWVLSAIPWCEQGFWITFADPDEALQLGNCGEHLMGLFYIQEASSMLPAVALMQGRAAKTVLDMAAAPGSKTTQLAALMENRGTLLANELSASRIKVLHANIQRCGVINSCLSHLDGSLLAKPLASTFDAILLDAPCGGEGTYRKDPKALDNWSLEAIDSISSLQKKLIHSAWKMLKPGGRLIYSTCTLSSGENHDVISALHQTVGSEMNIVKLDKLFPEASKVVTDEGYLLVWPEAFDCEGFFVACIEKSTTACAESSQVNGGQSPFKQLDHQTSEFVQHYFKQHFGFDCSVFAGMLKIRDSQREQQIWLFPEQGEQLRESLRLQRSGIRICDLIESRKGKILKTRNEFALCFGQQFTTQVIELSAAEAEDCCKGDNIIIDDQRDLDKGEALMRYLGYPLGIAKVLVTGKKITLKNNLPRDLLTANADFNSVAN